MQKHHFHQGQPRPRLPQADHASRLERYRPQLLTPATWGDLLTDDMPLGGWMCDRG